MTLEDIKIEVLNSQQCTDPDFGCGVYFDSEYTVVPGSSRIEDQLLAIEINSKLDLINKG